MVTAAPRSLADALRAMPDDALARLLELRPDLASPLPASISQLAGRAASRASVRTAIAGLDKPSLQVLEVVVILPDGSAASTVAAACSASDRVVSGYLSDLAARGLVWGVAEVTPVRAVREGLERPAGLCPLAAGGESDTQPHSHPTDILAAARATNIPKDLPATARERLEEMAWDRPIVRTDTASPQVEELVERGLVDIVDRGVVAMPRHVALALRGGVVHRGLEVEPPEIAGTPIDAARRDTAAVEAADEALRILDGLRRFDADPPSALRRGGIAVRDLRRLAVALDTTEKTLGIVLDAALMAGLIATDGLEWRLSTEFDEAGRREPEQRFAEIAVAWARSPRFPALAGTRGPDEQIRSALSDSVFAARAADRRAVLLELVAADPDRALDARSLQDRLAWIVPLADPEELAADTAATLDELAALGLTGAGAATAVLSALISTDARERPVNAPGARRRPESAAAPASSDRVGVSRTEERVAEALRRIAPAAVDEVLVQADLTAVVPGRPSVAVATLERWTDPVSRGGALVLRFTQDSVQRGLDEGRSADDLLDLLAAKSRAEIPQGLTYLVKDVARRHGGARVGSAATYVRAAEETLDLVLADPRSATLLAHRIAPTVLVTTSPTRGVVSLLRTLGLAPVTEGPGGVTLPGDGGQRPRLPPTPSTRDSGPSAGAGSQRTRASDPAARDPRDVIAEIHRREEIGAETMGVMDRLSAAIADRETLRIGIVDGRGGTTARTVRPLSIEAGRLRARDPRTGDDLVVVLPRIVLIE